MRNIPDGIENAAARLRDLGEKAADSASERLEDLKPAVDKAVAGAKDMFGKAGDGIEHAIEEARDALARAIDSLSAAEETPAPETEDVPAAPEKPLTPFDEIDSDVEAQLKQIRSAQQTPGAFSDYIARKFGKKDQ